MSLKLNHRYIYFFGLALLAASLPLSKVTMSIAEIILFANWILEGHFKNRFRVFFRNRIALAISSLFLLHVIGLIYTTDFNYAVFDLKVKVPILLLPLILSTTEALEKKHFKYLLMLFIAAVLSSTLISLYNYFTMDYLDIRDICLFISHIRLSLMTCLSIFILLYFVFKDRDFSLWIKILFIIITLWFAVFLVILESITGLSILFITALFLSVIAVAKMKNMLYKVSIIALAVIISAIVFFIIRNIYKEYCSYSAVNKNEVRKFTSLGNPYSHDTLNTETENGNYVYWNVNQNELRASWNKRSIYKYDSLDRKGQYLKYTLMRFLTSKGYYKDADGVSKLTNEEVHSIENGIASVNYLQAKSFRTRIYETFWELENFSVNSNPNGHSVMQRLEYWKASLGIIRDNLFFGVGTGDMNIAFAQQYDKMKSPLEKKWRLRSHNQFLSITVGFGLFGLLWFLICLIYPFFYKWVRKDYFYIVFFIIAILSMTAEDTIESQAGLTFFVFFNTLFLLGRKPESNNTV